MSNIERFWDTIIEEAAGKGAPPDLSREILAQLDAPAARNPRRGRTLLLRAGQFATAAAALFAIAWLTGLVRFGGESTGGTGIPACEDAGDPKVYAASPGAEVFERDGYVELKSGWLLVTTGAPEVVSGDSTLTDVDGRVLVHAPGRPTNEQIETATPWLNANRLETNMIKQMKAWATGATLAALVLSGSAILDGQEIEAPDEANAEPVWHEVSSVMDIEQLPEDATHVRGNTVKGAHLEFLAERTGLVAVDFRDCENLRKVHVKALNSLQGLRYLDLRGASWDDVPDYKLFGMLTELEELGVDYRPQGKGLPEGWRGKDWENEFNIGSTLPSLSDRGVIITLGNLSHIQRQHLEQIIKHISTLRELDLSRNNDIHDADLKLIAEHPELKSLDITYCWNVSELGLAYLAKHNRMTSLSMNMPATSAVRHQLSKLTSLKALAFLPLDANLSVGNSADKSFEADRVNDYRDFRASLEAISGFPKLTRVRLIGTSLPPEVAPMFREFPNASSLELDWSYTGYSPFALSLVQKIRAATLSGIREVSLEVDMRVLTWELRQLTHIVRPALQKLKEEANLSELEAVSVVVYQRHRSGFEYETPFFPRLFREIGSLKKVRFIVKQPDSLRAGTSIKKEFASYVEKYFADFEVETEYEVGDH